MRASCAQSDIEGSIECHDRYLSRDAIAQPLVDQLHLQTSCADVTPQWHRDMHRDLGTVRPHAMVVIEDPPCFVLSNRSAQVTASIPLLQYCAAKGDLGFAVGFAVRFHPSSRSRLHAGRRSENKSSRGSCLTRTLDRESKSAKASTKLTPTTRVSDDFD